MFRVSRSTLTCLDIEKEKLRSTGQADRLRSLAGKRVRVRAVKAFGLWDTDDPNVQSRVGDYLIIEEILEEGGYAPFVYHIHNQEIACTSHIGEGHE